MPLMNINSDWMSNASSGLYIIYAGPLSCMFDCSITWVLKLHLGMKCLCSDNDKMFDDRSWTLHGSFGKFYCNVSIIL